jgi:predicted DNA-binding transcriptional regulator AlpA
MYLDDHIDKYWPLFDLPDKLKIYSIDVSLSQLEQWESKHQLREGGTGFPDPIKLGRFKLYHIGEVAEWITLWRRATARMSNNLDTDGDNDGEG